jgi:hypothetical protein
VYNWKLADIQSLFGQAMYAGFRLQAGRMADRLDGVQDGTLYGGAINLSARTPLGPAQVSFGGTDNGDIELQFAIGRPIAEGNLLDPFE